MKKLALPILLLIITPPSNASEIDIGNIGTQFVKKTVDYLKTEFPNGPTVKISPDLTGLGQQLGNETGIGLQTIGQSLTKEAGGFGNNIGLSINNAALGVLESGAFNAGSDTDIMQKQGLRLVANNLNKEFFDKVLIQNLQKSGLILLGVAAGYFTIKYTIPIIARMFERYLTRPKLIIESSHKNIYQKFTSVFTPQIPLAAMVFSPTLEKQLNDIIKVTSTINAKIKSGKTNVKYRNLLLYGPPGTGKTMFAKKLAKLSGLEYAFMSGSSFSKFKEGEGIEALDELFAWAQKSKGLMIFIDEAETFLLKREHMDPQSKAYQLLNNFLNYTGQRSSHFMLVFATNHQDALDSAMYRRIDDLIEMPLPTKAQRFGTLLLYRDIILMDEKQNGTAFVDSVKNYLNNEKLITITEQTKGLSYGDLEGIINTIKTDSDIIEPALLNDQLINTVVERAIKKHMTFTGGKELGHIED